MNDVVGATEVPAAGHAVAPAGGPAVGPAVGSAVGPAAGHAVAATSTTRLEYVPWIEAARTVLMAGVVLVHVEFAIAPNVDAWWPFGAWMTCPLGSMVPAFFLIAGLLVGLGDPASPNFDVKRFVRRKVATLVIPFLIWNAIMVCLDIGLGTQAMLKPGDPHYSKKIVMYLTTGFWQLYFVSALLQCFAWTLLLRRFLTGRALLVICLVAVLVTGAFYGLASYFQWTGVLTDGFFENVLDRTFLGWCGYYFLGVLLGRRPRTLATVARLWWLWAALAIGAHQVYLLEVRRSIEVFSDTPLLQFIGSGIGYQMLGGLSYVGFFAWLGGRRLADRPLRAVAKLGALSLGVYLCHNAILLPLIKLWEKQGWNSEPATFIPIAWATTFALALLLTALGRYLGPPGRILFAHRAPAPKSTQAVAAPRSI